MAESSALLGALNSGHLPVHLAVGGGLRGVTSRCKTVFRQAARNPRLFAARLRQRLARILGNPHFTSRGLVRRAKLRQLDFLWTGTMIHPVNQRLVGSGTFVRYIHTLDADLMIDCEIRPSEECDYLLYLDSLGPSHPEYALKVNAGTEPTTMEDYAKHIGKCLSRIAEVSGLDVVIAAHPRASQGSFDGLYGEFPVKYQQTGPLICSARAVIAASGSTAVGMAAMAGKPVVFLTSKSFGRDVSRTQQSLADWIKPLVIDTDEPIIEWIPPQVNDLAYATFVDTFVKRQGSTGRRFWSHVVGDVVAAMSAEDPMLGHPSRNGQAH